MASSSEVSVGGEAVESSTFWGSETKRKRLRVALVRHGQSLNNVHEALSRESYIANRLPDPDLSHLGFKQAALLSEYLKDEARCQPTLGIHPVHELWVSPVKRTLQTMAPTAAALGLRPQVNVKLYEAGGIYDHDRATATATAYGAISPRPGLTRAEMAERFPTYTLPPEVTDQGWYRGAGKETTAECRTRARGVAEDFKAAAAALESDKNVVVVVVRRTSSSIEVPNFFFFFSPSLSLSLSLSVSLSNSTTTSSRRF